MKNPLNKLFKKKEVNPEELEPPKETELILLIEEIKMGIVDYFKTNGIEIKAITSDIEEAKIALIMSNQSVRIVVVETGLGEFNNREAKDSIADLLGVCEEDMKNFTIMYTTTSFKSEICKSIENKRPDTCKYESTVSILDKLQQYNEVYVVPGAKDMSVEDCLNSSGRKLEHYENEEVVFRELNINIDESEESLEKFDIVV